METGPQLLDLIHRKPTLIWGGGPYPFTSLIAFLMGYPNGYCASECRTKERHNGIHPDELLPADFHQFVTEWFGDKFPAGGRGWQCFIRENTSSEQEAFDLFFKLRAEYDRVHIAQPCAPPNGGPTTQLGNSGATEGPPSVS